jgi:hypothetical protein
MHNGRGVKAWHGATRETGGGGRESLLHRDASTVLPSHRATVSSVTAIGGAGPRSMRASEIARKGGSASLHLGFLWPGLESRCEAGTTFKEQHSSCSALRCDYRKLRPSGTIYYLTHSILHTRSTQLRSRKKRPRRGAPHDAPCRVSAGETPH